VWFSFQWLALHVSADAQAAAFLTWSLPLACWLGMRLFSRAHGARATSPGAGGAARVHDTALGWPHRLVGTR
jgi:hypothetical protein